MSLETFVRLALGALPFGMMFMAVILLPVHGPRLLLLATLLAGSVVLALAAGRGHRVRVFSFLAIFSGGTGLLFLVTDILRPLLDQQPMLLSWERRAVAALLYAVIVVIGVLLRRAPTSSSRPELT